MNPATIETVVQAIYCTEGGSHTKHPYGIMQHYQHTTPKNACFNTVNHFCVSHKIVKVDRYFITILSEQYCPPSVDPIGNKNWQHNMIQILHL